MNKRAILAVFAVVSVGVAATPAAAQDDCYRCETTYYANGAFHEVKVDPTVLLTTDGPAHDWISGTCEEHLHALEEFCWPPSGDPVAEILAASHETRASKAAFLATALPGYVVINAERGKVQIIGCDGVSIVAQFDLTPAAVSSGSRATAQ